MATSLPAALRWVDVILPPMLEYKTSVMRDVEPTCRYEAIPADLVDAEVREALFSQLGREASRGLVVAEGLLIYLSDEQVAGLATRAASAAGISVVAHRPREPAAPADPGEELGSRALTGQCAVPLCAA